MHRAFSLLFFVLATTSLLAQQLDPQTITVPELPATVDAYVALRDQLATTPEGGAVMFLVACEVYQRNPEEGLKMLISQIDRSRLTEGDGYKGFSIGMSDWDLFKRQTAKQKYMFTGYFMGATPANGYQLPAGSLQVQTGRGKYGGDEATGDLKIWVKCSGASTPRPIRLKKNNRGIWKAVEWSSVVVEVQAPKTVVDDDL